MESQSDYYAAKNMHEKIFLKDSQNGLNSPTKSTKEFPLAVKRNSTHQHGKLRHVI